MKLTLNTTVTFTNPIKSSIVFFRDVRPGDRIEISTKVGKLYKSQNQSYHLENKANGSYYNMTGGMLANFLLKNNYKIIE